MLLEQRFRFVEVHLARVDANRSELLRLLGRAEPDGFALQELLAQRLGLLRIEVRDELRRQVRLAEEVELRRGRAFAGARATAIWRKVDADRGEGIASLQLVGNGRFLCLLLLLCEFERKLKRDRFAFRAAFLRDAARARLDLGIGRRKDVDGLRE